MQKAVETFKSHLIGFRDDAISPALVDSIKLQHLGQMTPIKHVAYAAPVKGGVSVVPFDPIMVGQIAKVLKDAGLNAYVFSKTTVMVNVPPPSGEERQKANVRIKQLGEEARVAIRNIRKQLMKEVASLAKDEKTRKEKEIQKITDFYIAQIDEIVKNRTA